MIYHILETFLDKSKGSKSWLSARTVVGMCTATTLFGVLILLIELFWEFYVKPTIGEVPLC